jgi:hypothetical protein
VTARAAELRDVMQCSRERANLPTYQLSASVSSPGRMTDELERIQKEMVVAWAGTITVSARRY